MKDTVVVSVESVKEHPKYKKKYRRNKKYHVHAKSSDLLIGERVMIRECGPVSKTVKWEFVKRMSEKPVAVPEEIIEEDKEANTL
jgi:small subunit ribosomal protein S17